MKEQFLRHFHEQPLGHGDLEDVVEGCCGGLIGELLRFRRQAPSSGVSLDDAILELALVRAELRFEVGASHAARVADEFLGREKATDRGLNQIGIADVIELE